MLIYILLFFIILFILYKFSKYYFLYLINSYRLKNKVPVIISLTTSPKRINYIKPIIDSVLNQTITPNQIYLNLPIVFKRTGDTFDNIPTFLNNPKIYINFVEDIVPITKILPTFKHNFTDDTLIISIDDDTIYDKKMIEIILKYHQAFPNSVLTGYGYSNFSKLFMNPLPHRIGNMVEGFSAVTYPYKLFKTMSINLNILKECYVSDDFVLSNYINNKNIPIIIIYSYNPLYDITQLPLGYNNDALHKGGGVNTNNEVNVHNSNYKKCAKYYNSSNLLSKKLKYFLH